jgi:hypothetical protein
MYSGSAIGKKRNLQQLFAGLIPAIPVHVLVTCLLFNHVIAD